MVKILWRVPYGLLAVLNAFFLLVIWFLNKIGWVVVFINNNISSAGDWVGVRAGMDDKLQEFLDKVEKRRSM